MESFMNSNDRDLGMGRTITRRDLAGRVILLR
jgi:hypothetical protein